jgi:flagellar motor switch protein FliG
MADIFNNLDRAAEGRIMAALEERNRESAERIRALMFTFDDLIRLDGTGVQLLLRETLKDMFFRNLSERAAKILKDDIAALGAVRLRDVDEAQAIMVATAKDLAATGQILLEDGQEAMIV